MLNNNKILNSSDILDLNWLPSKDLNFYVKKHKNGEYTLNIKDTGDEPNIIILYTCIMGKCIRSENKTITLFNGYLKNKEDLIKIMEYLRINV